MSQFDYIKHFQGARDEVRSEICRTHTSMFDVFATELKNIHQSSPEAGSNIASVGLESIIASLTQVQKDSLQQLCTKLESLFDNLLAEIDNRARRSLVGERNFSTPDDSFGLRPFENAKATAIKVMSTLIELVFEYVLSQLNSPCDQNLLDRFIDRKNKLITVIDQEVNYMFNFFTDVLAICNLLESTEDGKNEPGFFHFSPNAPSMSDGLSSSLATSHPTHNGKQLYPGFSELSQNDLYSPSSMQVSQYNQLDAAYTAFCEAISGLDPGTQSSDLFNGLTFPGQVISSPSQLTTRPFDGRKVFSSSNTRKHVYKTRWTNCTHSGCLTTFTNLVAFGQHRWKEHGILPHRCLFDGCNKQFQLRDTLNTHLESSHHDVKEWPCSQCDIVITTAGIKGHYNLESHIYLRHYEGCFVCRECPITATNRVTIMNHYESLHNKNGTSGTVAQEYYDFPFYIKGQHEGSKEKKDNNGDNAKIPSSETKRSSDTSHFLDDDDSLATPAKIKKTTPNDTMVKTEDTEQWDNDGNSESGLYQMSLQEIAEITGKPIRVRITQPNSTDSNITKPSTPSQFQVINLKCYHTSGCSATFGNKVQLDEHLQKMHQQSPWLCFVYGCSQSFNNCAELIAHLGICHSDTAQWKCPQCMYVCKVPTKEDGYSRLHTHVHMSHNSGRFKCVDCDYVGLFRVDVMHHHYIHTSEGLVV